MIDAITPDDRMAEYMLNAAMQNWLDENRAIPFRTMNFMVRFQLTREQAEKATAAWIKATG